MFQEADDIQELSAEGRFLRLQDCQMFFFSLRVFFTGGKSADDESNAVQKGIGLMESFFEYLICMIYAKGKSLCSMFCS